MRRPIALCLTLLLLSTPTHAGPIGRALQRVAQRVTHPFQGRAQCQPAPTYAPVAVQVVAPAPQRVCTPQGCYVR